MDMTSSQDTINVEALTMQAVVREQYGSPAVLRLEEVQKPNPKAGEVLIRVHAASPNAADLHLLRGQPFMLRLVYGLFKPKIRVLGTAVAGRVAAVGAGVTRFHVGDEVFADLSGCGLGGFAEYACTPEGVLARMPAKMGFAEAATVPLAGVTASRQGAGRGRAEGADLRCLGRGWHFRGAAGQALRGRGDGGVQHPQGRAGALAGGRPGDLLHL